MEDGKSRRRMKSHGTFLAPIIASFLLAPAVSVIAQESTNRPANWAQPFAVAGIGNCFQVTSNLYRGAQPTAAGIAQLKAMGVRYVVSLRMVSADRHKLRGTRIKSLHLGMMTWRPEHDQVIKFLKAATDTNNLPLFVHCEHGADRTGVMCAMYRVVVSGWTKEAAIAEMQDGGFGFSWRSLAAFVEKADVEKYRREVGLATVGIADGEIHAAKSRETE